MEKARTEHTIMTKGLAVVFAIASGLAVGNLYWAQPLLAQITASFGVDTASGGLLVTATQVGYALGILLIVPLGDLLPRRRLITIVMLLSVAALVACAASPGFVVLGAALACLGLVTVSGQIILPLAGDLARPEERGSIVGIVSSGITTGILVARVLSGLVADLWGWRVIYIAAACLNLIMVLVIRHRVPEIPGKDRIPYHKLLAGVFLNFRKYPIMPLILLQTGMVFGITFNVFWTSLTFLLSDAPFHYNTFQIGLLSLVGLTGAIAGMGLGKLQDKGWGIPALGIFIAMALASMGVAIISGKSVLMIAVIGAVFSLAVQGISVLCQTRLFALSETERSRLNTAFVVNNFAFSALGSALASGLWNIGGWTLVMAAASASCLIALMAWAVARRSL